MFMVLIAASSCGEKKDTVSAKIMEIANSGTSGRAIFKNTKKGVKLTLTLVGKKNTSVAAHIHSGNECDYTDGSKALGHWNPTNEAHGYWGVEKHHSGDLGNIYLNSSGNGELVILDKKKRWSLEKATKESLVGKTIIIHSGYDDGKAQPSGNAGPRIGCGKIGNGDIGK